MAAIFAYFSALNNGDLDESYHIWFFMAAVAGSILVAGGILLESHWPISRMKVRERWGITLVILGVVIEASFTFALLTFDEGISRKQQETISEQQSKIVTLDERIVQLTSDNNALERLLVPRRFLPELSMFMGNFRIRMALFRGLKVLIVVVPDVEAKQFASDIYSSLKSTFGMDPEYIPVADPPDVSEGLFMYAGSSDKSRAAGIAIARMFDMLKSGDMKERVDPDIGSLTESGIAVSTLWDTPPNLPDVVRIDIGTRPFSETMLKLWHAPYPRMLPPDRAPAKAQQ